MATALKHKLSYHRRLFLLLLTYCLRGRWNPLTRG